METDLSNKYYITYEVTHADFIKEINSAENFLSPYLQSFEDREEAISKAKEIWSERKGESHVYREKWDKETDLLIGSDIIFVKTNDGREFKNFPESGSENPAEGLRSFEDSEKDLSKARIVTVQCYIFDGDKILIQNRLGPIWRGLAVPGGHIEPGETAKECCVRETKEETGLDLDKDKLCLFGEYQYRSDEEGDCIALLFKTHSFEGDLRSSEEGEMSWMRVKEALASDDCAEGFKDLLKAASENKIVSDAKISDIIKKTDQGYIIYSRTGKRLSKPFRTREQAEERLKQIEMFKHMKKDSQYKGYDIEYKGDLWQVWSDNHEGDRKLAGDFPSEEEAREWIDSQREAKPQAPARKAEPAPQREYHRFDVWYVDYDTDETRVEEDVIARSEEEARRIVKKRYGRKVYGYPHDVHMKDDQKENTDKMIEEVKRWLSKFLVKEGDPENRLGKTHIRPLKENERLPYGVRHKASTDTSGILHYKGGDYYWYLDGDEIKVERYHSQDSVASRYIAEAWKEGGKEPEDRIETNHLSKAKEWCAEKHAQDLLPRMIDKLTGEVWTFDESADTDLSEIEESDGYVHLWIVEWHDSNGVKFTAEFDAKEDADRFVSSNQDENHIGLKIREKDAFIGDSLKAINIKEKESKVRDILKKYLTSEGYEESDVDDYIGIHFKEFKNREGDRGVMCEIANDLGIDFYDMPDEILSKLEKEIGWIDPYNPHIWQSVLWDRVIADAVSESGKHEVKYVTYTQFKSYFDEIEVKEDEQFIEEYDTLEEARNAAENEDLYGYRGQYVEVFLDGRFIRSYDA